MSIKKIAFGFDDGTVHLQWLLSQTIFACYTHCRAQGMNDTEFAEYYFGKLDEIVREYIPASKHQELDRAMWKVVRALRAEGFPVCWPFPKVGESRSFQHER